MLRALRPAILGLVLFAAALIGAVGVARFLPDTWLGRALAPLAAPADGAVAPQLPGLAIGGPFDLVGPGGTVVTEASFPGKWQLIYFGYTACPDVCPTTLQTIAVALKSLGPRAEAVAPLFITVDPARDTPAALARYTALFDRRIIGLSGSPRQIAQAERDFHVYAAKVAEGGSGTYLMDHTSFVYLMTPRGKLAALFDRNVTAAALAARLRQALS